MRTAWRWAGLLMLFLVLGGAAHGAEIVLTNGSTLNAEILKETDEHLYLDLGFAVLSIPREQVESVSGGVVLGEPAPNVAHFFGPAPELDEPDTAVASDDRIYRVVTRRERAALKPISASELVSQYNDSVVVVSAGRGWGTGFIVDVRGYLITNYHVIAGADKIDVTLRVKSDGDKMRGEEFKDVKIVAANRWLDLALLKLDEEKLAPFNVKPVMLDRSENRAKGDTVFAIGNPGLGAKKLTHTVSEGIISSRARNLNNLPYMQTTAAVNPGNSGGPLFNDKGLVVGVVTLKAVWQEGIAFALPANYVIDFIRNREAFPYKKSELEYLDPPKKETLAEEPPKQP